MGELTLVPWGIAIGLAVSAPLGPINFMCIRQAVRYGMKGGILTGLGSVVGDGIFAAVAALGLSAVAGLVADHAAVLQLAGGLFLLVLGIHAWRSPVDPDELVAPPDTRQQLAIFATTLALTLTNPFTMTGFIAIFGGAAQTLARGDDYTAVVIIVGSVMAGSMLWWVFLSALVVRLKERFDSHRLAQINRWTAVAVTLFGVFLLARVAVSLI